MVHGAQCGPTLEYSKRVKQYPCGGPGKTCCDELDEELFAWFVDSIQNVKGRLPAFLLLETATAIAADLLAIHAEEKEAGRVPVHARLRLPKLEDKAGYGYLRRWRSKYGITYRTVSLRYKCRRSVLQGRLRVFWSDVLRVRILHHLLVQRGAEPREAELVIQGFDQKPCWFTAASGEKHRAFVAPGRSLSKRMYHCREADSQ